jgi:hypothetical protein
MSLTRYPDMFPLSLETVTFSPCKVYPQKLFEDSDVSLNDVKFKNVFLCKAFYHDVNIATVVPIHVQLMLFTRIWS